MDAGVRKETHRTFGRGKRLRSWLLLSTPTTPAKACMLCPNGDFLQMADLVPRGRLQGQSGKITVCTIKRTCPSSATDYRRISAPILEATASNDLKQQQNDHDQNDQADAAAAVVAESRSQAITTESKNQEAK